MPSLQCCIQCWGDFCEVCYHTCGLADGIILAEWDEIIMSPGKQLSDIFCSARKGVIGGYCDEDGPSVSQMAFGSHGYRGVSDTVGKLC